jgi:HD-like signal output (HDOD) protein/CheY-like chemotaxis protein
MKKRILFVDDEEFVLRGLDRLLRPMREEWDMEFVNSGDAALTRMDEAPFNVVISDMRMPGMNGAELLNEVMKRHPKTVRIILSGYADRELILRCVGSTHQYLAKPCDAKTLQMTLQRAMQLEHSLRNDTLRQLVTRCTELPSVPALYSKIIEALQDPSVDVEFIGEMVMKDVGITAKILKLANSAFFGLGHEIASPSEAIAYLGTDTVKSLILFTNTFSPAAPINIEGFSLETLWNHSLEVANASKAVAFAEGADRKLGDEAYVAGLLHDVGLLIFATNLGTEYQQVLKLMHEKKKPVAECEKQVFGATHADVGGYLLGLWGLPVPVVEAIALHHQPGETLLKSFSPLTAVHIGNAMVSAELPAIAGAPAVAIDTHYLASIGVKPNLKVWREAWKENRRH